MDNENMAPALVQKYLNELAAANHARMRAEVLHESAEAKVQQLEAQVAALEARLEPASGEEAGRD